MFRYLRAVFVLAFTAGAVAVAPSASAIEHDAAAQPLTTISVGATQTLHFLPFYIGVDKGFFAKHGLKIDYVQLTSTTAALVRGDIDFSLNGSDLSFVSAAQGNPLPMVAVLSQHGAQQLVIRKGIPRPNADKGYPLNLRDLPKSASVGVLSIIGSSVAFMQSVLGGAGLTDYKLVGTGTAAAMLAALKTGQIDAALLFEPYTSVAVNQGLGTVAVDQSLGQGGAYGDVFGITSMVNSAFLAKNPGVVKRYVAALSEAEAYNRDLKHNENELIKISAKWLGVTNKKVLRRAIRVQAKLAWPYFSCARAARQLNLLLASETISIRPACGQIAALKVIPKYPKNWKGLK